MYLHKFMCSEDIFIKLRIRFRRWNWNSRQAIVLWVSSFIIFGPFQLLFSNYEYVGSIFNSNPVAYSVFNGLFVATLAVGLMYLIDWIVKRRRSVKAY